MPVERDKPSFLLTPTQPSALAPTAAFYVTQENTPVNPLGPGEGSHAPGLGGKGKGTKGEGEGGGGGIRGMRKRDGRRHKGMEEEGEYTIIKKSNRSI